MYNAYGLLWPWPAEDRGVTRFFPVCSDHDQCQDDTATLADEVESSSSTSERTPSKQSPRPVTEEHPHAERPYRKGKGAMPCSAYEGFTCKSFIHVGNTKKKCAVCAKRAHFLDSLGDVPNPFLVHRKDCLGQEHPAYAEDPNEDKRIEALCFKQAEQLAKLLADNGERGFENLKAKIDTDNLRRSNDNIVQEAIDRLAFLQPHRRDFYHGAKCAGILPSRQSCSLGPLPNAAYDDDYKPYADAVDWLLNTVSGNATEEQKQHIDNLAWASDRSKAWCCRAALASACVAYGQHAGIKLSWATLKGGLCAQGDLPTWRSKGSLVGGPRFRSQVEAATLL